MVGVRKSFGDEPQPETVLAPSPAHAGKLPAEAHHPIDLREHEVLGPGVVPAEPHEDSRIALVRERLLEVEAGADLVPAALGVCSDVGNRAVRRTNRNSLRIIAEPCGVEEREQAHYGAAGGRG